MIRYWNVVYKRYSKIVIGFLLCSFATLLFCISSITQFDQASSIITGDSLELYVPGLRALARNIREGNSLSYSWDLFLGMNATEYYTAVVGGSFVNLIYILFPGMSMDTFVIIAIIIKGGLAGSSFILFSQRVLKVQGASPLIFSLFYALCGFQVAYNSVNFIWTDMVYMLPLILTLIVIFVEEKKWIGLVLSYAYLFLCNFYIAYIVGFFSAFFFLLYSGLYMKRIKEKGKKIVFFGGTVILAAGLVAFALVPTARFMITKYNVGDAIALTESYWKDPALLISRFLYGVPWDGDLKYPYLYSGIPVLMLLPFYFMDSKVERKEKLLYGILFLLMLVSCVCSPLYFFWHGFDNPDMWFYRFAFIISFLCITMACKEVTHLLNKPDKRILVYGVSEILLLFIILIYSKWKLRQLTTEVMVINVVLMWLWLGLAFILKHVKGHWKNMVITMTTVATVLEVVGNGRVEHYIFQDKNELMIWEKEMRGALEVLSGDEGFYRVNDENRLVINGDTYWGYQGINDFCSFENIEVRDALSKLGGYTSSKVLKGHGLNAFTQMILNVKYNIQLSGSDTYEQMGAVVVPYDKVLSVGFMVNNEIMEYHFTEDIFDNCNRLASAMTGQEKEMFTTISEDMVRVEEKGITRTEQEGTTFLLGDPNNQETNLLTFAVPNVGKRAYVVIGSKNRGILSGMPQIFEPDSGRNNGLFSVRYTKEMDYAGDELICSIMMKNGVTDNQAYYDKVKFCYLEEDILEDIYNNLKISQLQVKEYNNGYLQGSILVDDKEKVLFTSIPYDSGWQVTSNQGEVEVISLLEGAFLGVRFPGAGEYRLTFTYEAPGEKTGKMISLLSLGVLLIGAIIYTMYRKKTDAKQQE